MGLLQHLAEALTVPPGDDERRRDLLLSGAAMVATGIAGGFLARWLLRGGLSHGWSGMTERRFGSRTGQSEALLWLTLSGGALALVAFVFIVGGLITVAAALAKPSQ
jgi:hypothetical protein